MQNSDFEKDVQQQMDRLKFVPSASVWDKVEAGLPPEKNTRRWLFFLLLGAIGFGLLVWFNLNDKTGKQIKAGAGAKDSIAKQNIAVQNKLEKKKSSVIDSAAPVYSNELPGNKAPGTILTARDTRKKTVPAYFKIKVIKGNAEEQENIGVDNNSLSNSQRKIVTGKKLKIKIKKPAQYETTNTEIEPIINTGGELDETKTSERLNSVIITESRPDSQNITGDNSLLVNKKDTLKENEGNKTEHKKNTRVPKWQYGIYIASGSSNVTEKLFNNRTVFARLNSAFSNSGAISQPNSVTGPSNPSPSVAFNWGIFLSRTVNSRWKFFTGINYIYQSNAISVGSKIDSLVTLNFNGSKAISASNYYRAGNSSSYKNKFHLAELPLVFQFNLFARPSLYLEAGTTISYLARSNALIYDPGSSSYITNAAVFNRLLVGLNTGAGINVLRRSKLPFSVGYQFKYSATSAIKPSFGKQHFVNSLLYLKIPFKK